MAGAIGFRPVRYTNGAPWNGGTVRCSVLSTVATAVYIGDCVILAGTSTTSPVDGAIINDVSLCAAGNRIFGVVTAILTTGAFTTATSGVSSLDLTKTYRPASAYGEVLVAIAEPNLIFECAVYTGANLTVTGASAQQGTCFDITVAVAGSTTTGLSGHLLDPASGSTTSAGWYFWGVKNDPANLATVGTTTASVAAFYNATTTGGGTLVEVCCAEPQFTLTQVGAGV